jgi:hypothetical protein
VSKGATAPVELTLYLSDGTPLPRTWVVTLKVRRTPAERNALALVLAAPARNGGLWLGTIPAATFARSTPGSWFYEVWAVAPDGAAYPVIPLSTFVLLDSFGG